MDSCCSSADCSRNPAGKNRCPANGQEYMEVSVRTISHHIKESWAWVPTARHYYFCDDPACNVAYFGDDDSVILKSQLRIHAGEKGQTGDDLLCYCFGISKADFKSNPALKDFVVAQTRAGACSCETSNPSGRCCLKDFPKTEI